MQKLIISLKAVGFFQMQVELFSDWFLYFNIIFHREDDNCRQVDILLEKDILDQLTSIFWKIPQL